MHDHICQGGPLDGQRVSVAQHGFLLADRPRGRAWLYKATDAGWWVLCPNADGDTERVFDADRALAAALEGEYAVIALPEEEATDDPS